MADFAVIKISGKQYKVAVGNKLKIALQKEAEGDTIVCDEVLLTSDKDVQIGTPYLPGVGVSLKVLKHGKDKKIRVFKMKAKKRYRKTQGHRQKHTEVQVVSIGKGLKVEKAPVAKKVAAKKPVVKKTVTKKVAAKKPAVKKPAAKKSAAEKA